MAGIDLNRTSAGVSDLLPSDVSSEIWASTVNESLVMQAARRINLPGGGVTIPIITGDAEADWVAETDEKPVSDATVSSKSITPYKLAVIETFSNEFRRDLPGLYAELARRLPFSLGRAFDQTVLHGTAPGSNFDTLTGVETVDIAANPVVGLATALNEVAVAGGDVSHYLIAPQGEGIVRLATDQDGRYVFLSDPTGSTGNIGSLFGRPVIKGGAVYDAATSTVGFAGDFARSAIWGSVEGIQVAISDTATVNKGGTQLNLWQRNMFAIRAEVEVGFITRDSDHFVRLTAVAEEPGGGE